MNVSASKKIGLAGTGSVVCLAAALFVMSSARGVSADAPIVFENVTEELGLSEHLADWGLGHGGAWADVTGNDRPDIYIGAFAQGSRWGDRDALPNMLFLNEPDGFRLSPNEAVRLVGQDSRTAHSLLVDLNNNGRLDLLVGMHGRGPESKIFENRGDEGFVEVTPRGQWPRGFHMRNATAIDLDRDGLLDLILIDGRYGGDEQRVVALRNLGNFEFEDVSEQYGFPQEATPGLGTAVGDVNNNGRLDLFVAHANRMLVSQDDGTYVEYRPGFFEISGLASGAWPCGAAFADLTGNGLLDLVLTVHGQPGEIHLWVNRGIGDDGMPNFVEMTRQSGLHVRFPREGKTDVMLKTAQVAAVDLNNNGRRDILLGMIHENEDGEIQPVVFRNMGMRGDAPRFEGPPMDSLIGYYATAPVTDYDRDGRIDIFMATWFEEIGSHLFRNVTEGGNYLVVRVEGRGENLNPMGVGATVRLYAAGQAGNDEHFISRGDIALANGYSVGEEAMAHFGLGDTDRCDVVISWQGHEVVVENVEANQYLDVPVGE